ncbi:hypothetical protein PHYSODRAFT_261471 [Phytophthora sojae]|uniref:Uncharacterized protein n=1 Tax=Phytophthora sojae (strain P6497) TaxID=1094619 RepID=G4ZJN1_PHYSP|nr:hypothetical protein PHYSODRAFT_261471 [Phytophthora sojae]EGZ18251.1 hypothetical protein PHYSODRAFT_261471 [Phytophthora sojae]|eukprot:XP_009527309.1 hypothetical protein PHYSODRAFT_261471 [Phytophthora sojae]
MAVVKNDPQKDVIPFWNLKKKAKHRVWQAFWRAMLLTEKLESSTEEPDHDVKQVDDEKVRNVRRLAALEEAVVASGIDCIKSHWTGREHMYTAQLRQLACDALEGVDVFWNNPQGARDGQLDSVSCFGKMYVVPYPFHCVVVYDDANDEAIVRDECDEATPLTSHTNLAKLLSINFTPEVMAKRELRQKLRVLSHSKTPFTLPFTRQEKLFVGRKFRGLKWGIVPTFTFPGYYKFKCKYTKGVIRVRSSSDPRGISSLLSKLFMVKKAKMWGSVLAKSKIVQVRDHIAKMTRRAIMKADHIGLKPSMEESETLTRIFAQTRHIWENGSSLSTGACSSPHQQNATLSDDFWLHVYNNPHLSYKRLKRYLRLKESNPLLQKLPETHTLALDSLYARQKWAFRDPRTTCWFVFWDDVYACNSDMKLDPMDFDALDPTSICYREPMERQELEEWLRQRKLLHKWRKFNPALLDLLYEKKRDCSK